MRYSFHIEAEKELNQAVDYYEECKPGLGVDFASEVNSAIQNILDFPDAWAKISLNVRRCLTHRFPYGIIYSKENDEFFIIAVMHLHREPGYWKNRIK